MKRCGEKSPDGEHTCIVPEGRHLNHMDDQRNVWSNVELQAEVSRPKPKDLLKEHAGKAAPLDHAPAYAAPTYRNSDPPNSKMAAEAVEPSADTARGRVLSYLRERSGQWVDAVDLTSPEVGGFGGTRRMRELRDAGHDIETRQKPGQPNVWQHRLVGNYGRNRQILSQIVSEDHEVLTALAQLPGG